MNTKDLLQNCRNEINALDESILENLENRFDIVHKVSNIKPLIFPTGFLYIDPTREYEIVKHNTLCAIELGIPTNAIYSIWRAIISHANLMEQPCLRIYIPGNLDLKTFNEVAIYYPIKHIYTYYNNLQSINISDYNIIISTISQLNDVEFCEYLQQNNMHLYHIQESEFGEKICFFGRIYKLYSKNDGVSAMLHKEKQLIKLIPIGERSYVSYEDEYLDLGTSCPLG